MLRLVLFNIFVFLLPFILYGIYVYAARRGEVDGEAIFKDAPWGWLAATGLILMLIALGLLIRFSGSPPGGTYQPPRLEDGVIKPGRIE